MAIYSVVIGKRWVADKAQFCSVELGRPTLGTARERRSCRTGDRPMGSAKDPEPRSCEGDLPGT